MTAIDVSLAHTALTLPLLFEAYFIYSNLFLAVFALPGFLIVENSSIKREDRFGFEETLPGDTLLTGNIFQKVFVIFGGFLIFLGIVGIPLSIYLTMRFLLVDTIDLQMLLFDNYDGSLGWQYPTTFRFTILINRMNELLNSVVGNNSISSILSLFGIIVATIIGISALADATAKLQKSLHDQNIDFPFSKER